MISSLEEKLEFSLFTSAVKSSLDGEWEIDVALFQIVESVRLRKRWEWWYKRECRSLHHIACYLVSSMWMPRLKFFKSYPSYPDQGLLEGGNKEMLSGWPKNLSAYGYECRTLRQRRTIVGRTLSGSHFLFWFAQKSSQGWTEINTRWRIPEDFIHTLPGQCRPGQAWMRF